MPRRAVHASGWVVLAAYLACLHVIPGQTMRLYAVGMMLATCGGAVWHAIEAVRTRHRVWFVTAAALGCWAFAEVSVGIETVRVGVAPGRGLVANLVNLAALVLAVVAMLMVPAAPRDRADRTRMILDGVVATASLMGVAWAIVVEPIIRIEGPKDGLFDAAYPILSVGVLAVALIVLSGSSGRSALHALAGGVAVVSIALLVEIVGDVDGLHWLKTWSLDGYLLSSSLLALAPMFRLPAPAERAWQPAGLRSALLPYVPLVAYAIFCIGPTLAGRMLPPPALWAGTVTIGALMARQFLTLRRNVALTRDLAEERSRYEWEATHDNLTGLPNRAVLNAALASPSPLGLTLLMIDLDGFKAVNDTLGHAAGDQLLVEVAARIRTCIADLSGISARLGGDEFAVLVRTDSDLSDLSAEVLASCARPVRVDGGTATVRASIGIASREPGLPAGRLLHEADLALYQAKHHGKGQYRVFDADLAAAVEAQRRLESELGAALAADAFEVVFQPVADLDTGSTSGAEALLRWGDRPDDDFLPAAADAGLLPEIERRLIRKGVAQLAVWLAERPDFWLSVRLSPRYLATGTVTRDILQALAEYDVPPRALAVRIVDTGDIFIPVLRELRELGLGVALEGFGMGHTAPGRLRELPIHAIKLDPAFLRDLDRSPDAVTMLGAVIALISGAGVHCAAGGVETPEQLAHLYRLGCRRAQGPLFGVPVPADEFAWHDLHVSVS